MDWNPLHSSLVTGAGLGAVGQGLAATSSWAVPLIVDSTELAMAVGSGGLAAGGIQNFNDSMGFTATDPTLNKLAAADSKGLAAATANAQQLQLDVQNLYQAALKDPKSVLVNQLEVGLTAADFSTTMGLDIRFGKMAQDYNQTHGLDVGMNQDLAQSDTFVNVVYPTVQMVDTAAAVIGAAVVTALTFGAGSALIPLAMGGTAAAAEYALPMVQKGQGIKHSESSYSDWAIAAGAIIGSLGYAAASGAFSDLGNVKTDAKLAASLSQAYGTIKTDVVTAEKKNDYNDAVTRYNEARAAKQAAAQAAAAAAPRTRWWEWLALGAVLA